MYKSINQWSFAGGMDAKACLLAAKAAGFAGFEPAFDAEGPLSPKAGDSGARELRALAESEGVRLPSLASGLYWQHPLTAESLAARKIAEDIVRAQLDCAAALGVGEGDWITIESTAGTLAVRANPTARILPGCLQMYHGYREADANELVGSVHLDPYSGYPGYNCVRCRIRKGGGKA